MKNYSDNYTPHKERKYMQTIKWHCKRSKKNVKYTLVDTHSGPGMWDNGERIVKGSPVIGVKVLKRNRPNYSMVCFERNESYIASLKKTMFEYDPMIDVIHAHNGNCAKFMGIKEIAGASGLIYSDATGITNWGELHDLYANHPNLDILVHCSMTAIKRHNACRYKKKIAMLEEMQVRKNWFISKPKTSHNWVFLFGSNKHIPRTINKFGLRPIEGSGLKWFTKAITTAKGEIVV